MIIQSIPTGNNAVFISQIPLINNYVYPKTLYLFEMEYSDLTQRPHCTYTQDVDDTIISYTITLVFNNITVEIFSINKQLIEIYFFNIINKKDCIEKDIREEFPELFI